MKNLIRLTSIACLSLLMSAPLLASNIQTERFTIISLLVKLKHINLGESGGSLGDLFAFESSFADKDGKKGVLSGVVITVGLPGGVGEFYDRLEQIVYDFGGVDSLVVTGKSSYGKDDSEMVKNKSQVRAVTGGTGRYIGARGQVITTRLDAERYEHVIELVK